MATFKFHMGVTLRCYGNVEVEAESIEAALPLLTADFIGENIDITETTTDSGQDLAVIDVVNTETGDDPVDYDGHPLPSPYDPKPDAELLAALKALRDECSGTPRPWILVDLLTEATEVIAKAEGRTNG